MHYKVYKDRYLLSFSLSILAHALIALAIILILYLLPPKKQQKLMPLTLNLEGAKNNIAKDTKGGSTTPFNPPPISKHEKNLQKQTQIKKQKVKNKPIQKIIEEKTPKQKVINKIVDKNKTIDANKIVDKNKVAEESTKDIKQIDYSKLRPVNNTLANPTPSLSASIRKNEKLSPLFKNQPQSVREDINRLYGEAFGDMSKQEQDYVINSYKLNGEVFQYYANRVGYPPIAAHFNQQGAGIVEFYLYPDGSISDIKIVKSSSFSEIDNSIKHIVDLAAKDLKRPPTKVRVRLQGNYFLR